MHLPVASKASIINASVLHAARDLRLVTCPFPCFPRPSLSPDLGSFGYTKKEVPGLVIFGPVSLATALLSTPSVRCSLTGNL